MSFDIQGAISSVKLFYYFLKIITDTDDDLKAVGT